jgi:hypothetical protein
MTQFAIARREHLIDQITKLEKAQVLEYRGSNRRSVQNHYQRQIDAHMAELVDLLPEPEPEPTQADLIRREISKAMGVYLNAEDRRRIHQQATERGMLAKKQFEENERARR